MGGVISSMLDALFSKSLEIVIVGLDGAGKSTLINVLCAGAAGETAPTVGLEVRQFRKGNLKIKAWDLAGGASYRQEWSRYARGVDCIMFVLDAADPARLASARKELHRLLEDNALAHTPLLVCANKVDLTPHLSEEEVVKGLNLDYVMECVGRLRAAAHERARWGREGGLGWPPRRPPARGGAGTRCRGGALVAMPDGGLWAAARPHACTQCSGLANPPHHMRC
jgi:ADP-ribosylation factor-like protein 8